MAISLTHTTVAVGTDAGNGEIAKAQWNENHTLEMSGGGKVLGRATAGDGAVEELSEITLASGTKTASAPVLDMSQTWNNAAVTFTGLKLNVTSTASSASSLLADLQVGGTSLFKVDKTGALSIGSAPSVLIDGSGVSITNSRNVVFSGTAAGLVSWGDVFIGRRGAANLRLGAADAASPVAQTLSVQSVVAGTTNTAGANLTITGSQGTGTGAGGSIIFQVAPAGSSGSAQNALSTALTIASDLSTTFAGAVTFSQNLAIAANKAITSFGTNVIGFPNQDQIQIRDATYIGWGSTITSSGNADVRLYRDASAVLALRNGTNAQAFRVYNTYTDASNYERARVAWSSNTLIIGTESAGTGSARGLEIQTNGTLRLSFASTGSAYFNNDTFISTSAVLGFATLPSGGTNNIRMSSPSDGVLLMRGSGSSFGRMQFGGTTSSFPALKQSSAVLQARLADDSGFASVQGKLTTDTNYSAGAPTPTGYLVVYDAAGTAYKIPAEAV